MVTENVTTQNQEYDLITRGSGKSGGKNYMYIANKDAASATVDVYLVALSGTVETSYHFIHNLSIPAATSLGIKILPFDSSVYSLRVKATTASPIIDIILGNG